MNVDLHVHSALSACAENVLSPVQILQRARQCGLHALALTDHNTAAHVQVALELAPKYGVLVIAGMEVMSREEVHLLTYFPGLNELLDFQALVDHSLPKAANVTDVFGYQVLYDIHDEIIEVDEKMRQTGINLGLERLTDEVHARQGFAVPAHVFKARFSLTSQLGLIDEASPFDAVEVSRQRWQQEQYKIGDRIHGFAATSGSDAHFLEDIGSFFLELPQQEADITAIFQFLKRSCAAG